MGHIDLDAVETVDGPVVTFTLDGREWVCKQRGQIPAVIVDGLLGAVPMPLGNLFAGLLEATVDRDGEPSDQLAEFGALLDRPDSPLTFERAQLLAKTVAEAVLNRPTGPSSLSQRGRQPTGGTSKGGSSSPAGRSKKRAG